MKRLSIRLIPAVVAALVVAGCASTDRLVHTSVHPQLAQRGGAVIGQQLDTKLLGSLIFDYFNLFRARHNLSLFGNDPAAESAAEWMARYQAGIQAVTHETTISGMQTVAERYTSYGGREYAFSGENAAWTPMFDAGLGRNLTYDEMARRILDNWINSPHHFANLVLSSKQTTGGVGIGIAQGAFAGWDGVYATMDAVFPWPEETRTASRVRQRASTRQR